MRIGALLGISAALAAGGLAPAGQAAPQPPTGASTGLSPRGSVAVFNADGRQAPVTVGVPSGPATPTRVAQAFLARTRPAAAAHLVPGQSRRLDATHTVVRLGEVHDGVPVIAGEAVVVLDDQQRVVAASSEVLADPPPDTTPALSVAEARRRALDAVAREAGRAGLVAGDATLAIFDPRLVTARGIGRPALVWDVNVRRSGPSPLARRVLVDAQMGAIAL